MSTTPTGNHPYVQQGGSLSGLTGPHDSESAKLDLITWLQMVAYHSQSGSTEDHRSLKQLAHNLPDYSTAPENVRVVFQKIQAVVAEKKWDKDLSPVSSNALLGLMRQLSPNSQARALNNTARRKLVFDDSIDNK